MFSNFTSKIGEKIFNNPVKSYLIVSGTTYLYSTEILIKQYYNNTKEFAVKEIDRKALLSGLFCPIAIPTVILANTSNMYVNWRYDGVHKKKN